MFLFSRRFHFTSSKISDYLFANRLPIPSTHAADEFSIKKAGISLARCIIFMKKDLTL
jgi:hypothetical protein